METKYIDHFLLGAVRDAVGIPTVLYDLKRVKKLVKFDRPVDPYYINVASWLKTKPGAFELLGEMPNLHTLLISSTTRVYGQIYINDFSFLKNCKKLKKLDLSATNFTDCRLLLDLPALQSAVLPPLSQLTHTEVISCTDVISRAELAGKVRTIAERPVKAEIVKPVEKKWEKFLPSEPSAQPAALPEEAKRAPTESPKASAAQEPLQQAKGKEASEMIKKLVELFKERTAQDAYSLTIQPDVQPDLCGSKLSGLPYWDLSKPVPVDGEGKPMLLLAQINFDRAGTAAPLPTHGMLQFFIRSDDDVFGACFDGEDEDKNFRVIYHGTVDESVTREQVAALGFLDGTGEEKIYTPVYRELAVKVEKAVSYMTLADEQAEPLLKELARSLGVEFGGKTSYDALNKEDRDYLWDNIPGGKHWMLGHPYFTQYDPRDPGGPYDTLLLQIDTDGEGRDDYVMWGDAGVGNFFINREKLEQLDFSDVMYTWDCC